MNTSDIKKQLAKLQRDKKLLWLGVLFFVVVVLWILTSIFTTSKTSSISPELKELAKPFVPRLESKVFDEIALKRVFSQEELSVFPIYIFSKISDSKIDKNGAVTLINIMKSEEVAENISQDLQLELPLDSSESSPSATQ